MAIAASSLASDSWYKGGTRCPVLDVVSDPVYTLALGYSLPADVEGGKSFSLLTWEIESDLFYFRDLLLGDLDLKLQFETGIALNGGGLKLPDQLLVLAVDHAWTWRYVNDTAFQWRFAPGIYSAFDSIGLQSLSMPMAVLGIKTFNSHLSGVAGVAVRVGFERVLMPVAGLVWQPDASFRVEAMIPESRLVYHVLPDWTLHAEWYWRSLTYQLPDDRFDRDAVTFESQSLTCGVTWEQTPEFRIRGELGWESGREIEFDRGGNVDIDPALLVRFGIGGAF